MEILRSFERKALRFSFCLLPSVFILWLVRFLPFFLIALIALIQYPLWLGKGSWLRVWEVDQQLVVQRKTNAKLMSRNSAMDAEVRDLKQGMDAIEERARSELGMIKQDEVFVQVLSPNPLVPERDKTAEPERR